MNFNLQRELAKKAGMEDEYDYHLGMVDNPLPFERFRMKTNLLMYYLKQDPEGEDRSLDREINRLSRELGC